MAEFNPTQLDQFPYNIIQNILSLTEEEGDGNLRLVCRKFKNIFDETIGLCWGKLVQWDNEDTEREYEFDELPSCRKFYFSSVLDQMPVALPSFKRKHLLHKMQLSSRMTNSSLNHILTGLASLEILKLYDWGISNLTSAIYLNDIVNLKKLTLTISDLDSRPESIYFELINFLKVASFPCLQELNIQIYDPSCENIFCDALLKFLIQHKTSITTLNLELWNMRQGDDWPDLPDFHDRLNELENHKIVKISFTNYYLGNMTKLAEIFDKIVTTGNMIKEADECRYFCNTDPDDYYLYCEDHHAPLKPIPRQMLQNNYSTLVNIGLNIMPEDCRPLDCSIFVPCTSLKELQLFTRLDSGAELTNAAALPITLESFLILHFQMKSEEIHSIATNNINLNYVYFGHTGTENGYGVKLESFTCISARRQPNSHIMIVNSWNVADINESLHNRGPFHRMQALALIETKEILLERKYARVLAQRRKLVKRIHSKVMTQPIQFKQLAIVATDMGIYEDVTI